MDSFATDTQALVKFMMGLKVIDEKSHKAFLSADRGESVIIISAVVLMEILYLFEKNRIKIDLLQTEELLKSKNYQVEPLTLEILKTASEINDIPELHDRLIAATARYLDLPLITNDPAIRASTFIKVLKWYYKNKKILHEGPPLWSDPRLLLPPFFSEDLEKLLTEETRSQSPLFGSFLQIQPLIPKEFMTF